MMDEGKVKEFVNKKYDDDIVKSLSGAQSVGSCEAKK